MKASSRSQWPAALNFLVAARRSEWLGLQRLAETCDLVMLLGRLIHALQRERGYSNLYLGLRQASLLPDLQRYSREAIALQQAVCAWLEPLQHEASERMRLLDRIAFALHGMASLPALRRQVQENDISLTEATTGFTRQISSLIHVVFEAADTASDPILMRTLVALFNFMQGKELAGQERALGVHALALGYLGHEHADQLTYFVEGQNRCFDTFLAHADDHSLTLWREVTSQEQAVLKMRALLRKTSMHVPVNPQLAETWFALTTLRLDAMHAVESNLEALLQQQASEQIVRAQDALDNHRLLAQQLVQRDHSIDHPLWFSVREHGLSWQEDPVPGVQLDRALITMLQVQQSRLEQLSQELRQTREKLSEQRRIEEAKTWLMQHQQITEHEAYERIRRMAMNHGARLVDVADQILRAPEVF